MLFCGTNALADGLIQCIGAGIDLVVNQLQGEFILLGQLIEFGDTTQLFSMPRDKRTEDYITGRFG